MITIYRKCLGLILFWLIVQVHGQNSIPADLCHQPIGISDGQISDISVNDKLSAKKNSDSARFLTRFPDEANCNKVSYIEMQFGKPMTIKGIAFRSWSKMNGIEMLYAFRNADPWALVGRSVRGGDKPKEFRDFSCNGTGGDIEYKNIDDWITVQYVRIDFPTAACIQMEFYGCPEVCHSFITYPELQETWQNSSSTEFECIKDKTISFQHAITMTGIKLDFDNETEAELEMECINYKTSSIIKAKSRMPKRSTVLWLDKEYICDAINLKLTSCKTFSVIGCSSGSISKLGLQIDRGLFTANGSSDDTNFTPNMGRLHSMGGTKTGRYLQYSGWLSKPFAKFDGTIWLRVDFPEDFLVHGIAISGSGNAAHYATLEYSIDYIYNGATINYNNKEIITSAIQSDKYRYLTDIKVFNTSFLARNMIIFPHKCANDLFTNNPSGCGIRWEILGSSKSLGNLPRPKIIDDGRTTQCVSLYVENSDDVSFVKHPKLLDTDYKTEETKTSHKTDGYKRLNLKFLEPRLKLFAPYKQVVDDIERGTLYYYLTFQCTAKFGNERLTVENNVTVDFEEHPNPPSFIKFDGYHDNQTIAFSWSSNTSELLLKKLSYNVTVFSTKDDVIIYQSPNINENKTNISGFDQLTNYTVVVQSRNKYTFSKETTDLFFLTMGASKPLKVSASNFGLTQFALTFDEPDRNFGDIVGYQAYCRGSGEEVYRSINKDDERKILMDNLEGNTKYECKVRALVTQHKIFGEWSDVISAKTLTDLCHQPIGISDGQISDVSVNGRISQERNPDSARFLTSFPDEANCNKVSFIETQFGKPMTIKGIAFRSWSKINGIEMLYAFRNADPWVLIGKSVRGGDKPKEFRKFSYNGENGEIEYKNIGDWITLQYMRIDLPNGDANCLQMELYGCPEVCHSFITYPDLQETGKDSPSTEFECVENKLISFQHAITLTGIKLDFDNETKAELEMECINYQTSSTIKAKSQMAKRSTVLWFDKEYICDAINLKTTVCSTFSVIGCSSASMSSLGVQDGKGTLSAVGSSTDTNFKAVYGRLHDFGATSQRVGRYVPYSGWLSQPLQAVGSSVPPSFTVNLVGNSLIHGIAISGAGNAAHYATLSYTIAYVYDGKTIDYDNAAVITSAVRKDRYRYLTDIQQFKKPFMAKEITILPYQCANDDGENYGCGLRVDILGSASNIGKFPRPKINDDGQTTECVSIYVANSDDVSIINNTQLTRGKDYTVVRNVTSHSTTGYRRLKVEFNDDRVKLFSPFNQIDDDLQKKSLYYYVMYKCQAKFGSEAITGEYRVKAYYEEYPHPAFNLTKTFKNVSTISFTWKTNTTGLYLKQLFYNLTIYSQEDGSKVRHLDVYDDEIIEVSGLPQMRNYTLVLQSRNKYTYSLETTTIAFQTKGASEPLNIVTTDIQTTGASLSFDQPLHVNGDIVAYQTRCKGPGDELVSEILNINSFSGESVVRNLAPNRRYKCQIRALVTRHHIFGEWSDVIEFVTKRGKICQQITTKKVIPSTRQTYNISIGQVMKITGFAVQGLPRSTNFTLKYSTNGDSNDMKNVLDASVMDGVTAEKRVFTTSVEEGNVQRFWFNDDVIEMQIIEFVFENPQPVDFIEVYGCTQFCSSILPSPSNIFDDQTSTMESNTQICSPSLYHLSFESHVTLSGLWMTSLVDEINESNFTLLGTETQVQCGETNQIIEVKAEHQETGLMFWFPSKLRCRSIMINKTIGDACFNVSFVGCPSDCTRQLVSEVGLPNINMTLSSGDYGDSTLNNMNGGWVPENGDSERWLEACFPHPVYVTSVALQNAPDVTSRNKITYELTYGFTGFRKNYTDKGTSVIFDGPDTFYEASLQKLPTAITATCLRLKLRNASVAVRWEIIGCLEGEQPSINQLPQITTPKGQQTSLQCLAQGQPGLNIEWSSQAGQLHKYTSENRDSVFRRFSDFEIIQQSNLTVHSNISFYIRDDSNNVSCVVDMETMTSATADCWLSFSCATFYERGLETSNLTSLVVTGFNASVARPKINETSFKTNTSLLMDWSPGSNTGSDFSIIGYNVTLATKQQDILYQDVHYGVDNQTQFVDNLQPYTVYTLAVSAFNRFRIYSPPAEYDFTTDEAAPSKITNITKEVATNSTLCISWKPPFPANGVLSEYTIEYKKTNTSDVLSAETMENRFVIRELKFDSHYLIRIRASTKENTLYGQWADWISFATLEGRPSQPLNLEFTTTSSSNVSSLLLKGVLSWKPPLHMNGRFQRYVIKFEGFKDYMAVQFTQKSETSQNNRSINLDPIYPGTKYRFEVFAVTGGGNGTRAVLEKDIPVAAPDRAVMGTKGATMEGQKIEIYQIEQLTGPIAFYNFAISTLVKGEKSGCFNTEKIRFESNITNPQTAESDGNLPLETVIIRKGITLVMIGEKAFPSELDGDYEFCVRAVVIDEKTKEHFYGEPASIEIERRDLSIARTSPKRSLDTIQVPIPLGPTDTRYYFVIVNPTIEPLYDPKPSELSGYNEKKPDSAYISGVLTQYQSSYLVGNGKSFTIPDWQRNLRRRSTLTDGERQRSTLLHNDGETGTTYENVALKKGTNYAVLVRAHVDEDTYYSSPWILTNTTSDIVVTPVVTPEDDQTGLIAGVIVAFLLVALLAGAVFFYIRRKNGRRPSKSHLEKAVSLQPLGEDNQSYEGEPINTDFKKPLDVSEPMGAIVEPVKPVVIKPPSKVVINKKYKPIQLMDFSERCEELRKDSHHELSEEYKALHSGQLHDWSEAVIPEIRTKNRYANIVAYNHSRVKLKTLNDMNSNYVNASFIHGYRKPNTYIASQGPNQASMNDFWQMIWEQEVSVIVMATNLVEKNKKKCECYWPQKGSIAYGSIVVTVNTMDTYADFVIRSFTLQQNNNKEIRTLQQYHYLSWPDHGVPEFPSDILSLRHKIRKDHPVNMSHSPILVHCSAGVGRTGTFICIDNLLQLAVEENIVDVFNFVNFMRTRRIHMVQTEEQYMFIYKSLLESFTCGITEIDVSRFGNEYQRLLRPNQNGTTKNGFHLQFERLNKVTNDLTEEETANANEAENVNKNRTSILPRDTSRVFLRASIYEEHHGSNYINAIFVNGYKQKDAFIATQHPLESTIIDFWKMVFEKEVGTIVMLNALYEEDQAYETFWPSSEESLVLNEMQVVCLSEDRSNIKETRRFELSHKDNAEKTLHTTLFNYVKWPHDGAPQNPSDIIQLLSSIEATQSENPEKPIIVICSDGAGRSGTFIAISILMEQLKLEHSIDVFQTIKKIRSTRPEFVQNEVQYQFCYNMIKEYMDSFSTYSNFTD